MIKGYRKEIIPVKMRFRSFRIGSLLNAKKSLIFKESNSAKNYGIVKRSILLKNHKKFENSDLIFQKFESHSSF